MMEIRVLTVPLDPRTGLFDDGPVWAHLATREVLRSDPHFHVHDGRRMPDEQVPGRPGAAMGGLGTAIPSMDRRRQAR
ncbi:MAG TPA: hypothetical protein PLQ97_03425 [Myxococcota bacterium]|nr:hypothetical protein [Myxococcota bacterium]HQK50094.1 hypothetical protein [Myxococcota bacterium]